MIQAGKTLLMRCILCVLGVLSGESGSEEVNRRGRRGRGGCAANSASGFIEVSRFNDGDGNLGFLFRVALILRDHDVEILYASIRKVVVIENHDQSDRRDRKKDPNQS